MTKLVTIRIASDEDYSDMAALRRDTILNVNSKDYSEDVVRNWSDRVDAQSFTDSAPHRTRWVAMDGRKMAGFCEHDKTDQITRLYVDKDHLRRGIGTLLLRVAENSLLQNGSSKIELESTITAKIFYMKNGYEILGKALHHEDGGIYYKMSKFPKVAE